MSRHPDGEAAPTVVLDTNVFVAAGFRPGSASARLVDQVRQGHLRMTWNEATRGETRAVLRRIPPLDWMRVAPLFRAECAFAGETRPDDFEAVSDPSDRVFAALAAAAQAWLVSSDRHLLSVRHRVRAAIVTPGEFLRRTAEAGSPGMPGDGGGGQSPAL